MANLTIALDDQLLRDARVKAAQKGTSVNEVCREAIERFAREPQDDPATRISRFRALARQVTLQPVGSGPVWPGREALYDEALRERGLLGDDAGSQPAAKASRQE